MKQFQTMIVLLLALAFLESSFGSGMEFEDIVIPDTCDVLANVNDHVLFSFRATFENNTAGPEISPTSQPYYTLLDATSLEGLGAGIKGMCENSTRRLKFEDISADANKGKLSPVITPSSGIYELEEEFTFEIHLHKVTSQDDYQIFDAFKKDNISMVLDLIEQHKGINAMDE